VGPERQAAVAAVVARLRENLKADGCDLELVEATADGRVVLTVVGGASCCPMSRFALVQGLESAIRAEVPEVVKVELRSR